VAGLGRLTGLSILTGLCLTLILFFGGCDNPANGNNDDNTAVIAQEAADIFYSEHSAVLELPAALITIGDEAAIKAALQAYEGLSVEAKSLLAGEKAHLDGLQAKITGLNTMAEKGAYYTIADLTVYLNGQPENTPDTPYTVTYYGNETIKALYSALEAAGGKYVSLDLSASSIRGIATGNEEARAFIVSLILPDSLTEIPDGTNIDSVFHGFINLKTVRATGLITLGAWSFRDCTSLTEVSLPKVVSVGQSAFDGCVGLPRIALPEAVTIGTGAFRGSGLTAITYYDLAKAETLGSSAFGNCTLLTTVTLPKAETLGGSAFVNCTSLGTVSLTGVTSVGTNAFQGCTGLSTITLSRTVSIGNFAFQGCTNLRTVNLPEVVTTGSDVFQTCPSLVTISLPKAETIGAYAFQNCTSLTTVTLPKAETIGNYAFQSCTSLTTVTLGHVPPAIGTRIFQQAAAATKTITIKAPQLTLYTPITTPWNDKIGTNNSVGNFWDNNAATRDNLTVALIAL
jgi:hypothetical protein